MVSFLALDSWVLTTKQLPILPMEYQMVEDKNELHMLSQGNLLVVIGEFYNSPVIVRISKVSYKLWNDFFESI